MARLEERAVNLSIRARAVGFRVRMLQNKQHSSRCGWTYCFVVEGGGPHSNVAVGGYRYDGCFECDLQGFDAADEWLQWIVAHGDIDIDFVDPDLD